MSLGSGNEIVSGFHEGFLLNLKFGYY
jgi:hypothetical protein